MNGTTKAEVTTLSEANGIKLTTVSQGWEAAGSGLRWTDGYCAVSWYRKDGSFARRTYPSGNVQMARDYFDILARGAFAAMIA